MNRRPGFGQYQVWPAYSTSLGCGCGAGLGTEPPPDQGGAAAPGEKAPETSAMPLVIAAVVGFGIGALLGGAS